jgi:hypothetical protein
MEIIKGVQDFPDLPTRRGKRPITIRGPLHVQCGGHGDEGVLRQVVQQVIAWPGIEAGPLPIGIADLVSLKLAEDFATRLHYRERVWPNSFRRTNDLSRTAVDQCSLGYCPWMGRASFLWKLWVRTAGCDGCLHAA